MTEGDLFEDFDQMLEGKHFGIRTDDCLDLTAEQRQICPRFEKEMLDPFYQHSYYDLDFVEKTGKSWREKLEEAFKELRFNYVSNSPDKEITVSKEPEYKTEEDLASGMLEVYRSASSCNESVISSFSRIRSHVKDFFTDQVGFQSSIRGFITGRLAKSKKTIIDSSESSEIQIKELKLQLLFRLETERLGSSKESLHACRREAVELLRCIMFLRTPDEMGLFVHHAVLDLFTPDLKPLLLDISRSLGVEFFSDEEDSDPEDDTEVSSQTSCLTPWSFSSVSNPSSQTPPRREGFSHIPPSRRGDLPPQAPPIQILVPSRPLPKPPVKKPRMPPPLVTTPEGKHVLKTKFVRSTPEIRQGPRSEMRKKKTLEDSEVTVVPRTPLNEPPNSPNLQEVGLMHFLPSRRSLVNSKV